MAQTGRCERKCEHRGFRAHWRARSSVRRRVPQSACRGLSVPVAKRPMSTGTLARFPKDAESAGRTAMPALACSMQLVRHANTRYEAGGSECATANR
jgi:hypothetical protein